MNTKHHLDDTTLIRFAAGELDEAFSLVAATHLAMCGTCRENLAKLEEVGGAMMAQIPTDEVALAPNALESALKACNSNASSKKVTLPQPSNKAEKASDVPLPLTRYLDGDFSDVKWKMVAPGIHRHTLTPKSDTQSTLYMLKLASGKKMPEHGHHGDEITLVLKGAYRDSLGLFGPGDVADLDEHVEHQPVVEPGEPCICLIATQELTKFKRPIDRLLQPIVGI